MYDIIKAQMTEAVPFAKFVGINITELSDGEAVAILDQRPDVSNHIGSLHAGAMFTLGEAASGSAMAGAVAPMLMQVRPVAANATIEYLKVAKGVITARTKTSLPGAEIQQALNENGKIQFDVHVAFTDESAVEVGRLTVAWHLKKTS